MPEDVTYGIGLPPDAGALCSLRESVGWDRAEDDYPAAFEGYDTCVTARDPGGALVGWCAAVSDGVRHAFLIDVIVRPDRQGRGVGRGLVGRAVADLEARGITIIHADFTPENAGFYERCGFRPSAAGILEIGEE